jgi:pilus assembly protein CpaD
MRKGRIMALRFLRLFAAALSVSVIAGCGGPPVYDYNQRYPLSVSQHTAVTVIDEPAAGRPLTDADLTSLEQLGRQHLYRGAGPVRVTVAAPPGDAAQTRAKAFALQVAAGLQLPASDVIVAVVGTNTQRAGKALVQAPVWVAKVPTCGEFDRHPTPDYRNGDMPNFGCSIQRNVGLMVQNPADLVRMRADTGRSGARAVDVMDKYVKGAATDSAKEHTSGSTASDIGK